MGVSNEVGVFRVISVSVSAPGSYKKGRRYDKNILLCCPRIAGGTLHRRFRFAFNASCTRGRILRGFLNLDGILLVSQFVFFLVG